MKSLMMAGAAGLFALVAAESGTAATFNVTIEAPGVENSTAGFSFSGIETFDSRAVGNGQTFTTNFGTGTTITGTYRNIDVRGADQFGGAGGNTNFASTATTGGYTLDLATTNPAGINYFGFYLSALDSGNQLAFYSGTTLVYSFSPADVLAKTGGSGPYFGNPDAPYKGFNSGQPYAFLNFYDTTGTFDRIVFSENPQVGGYESDNHTVGFFTRQGGTPIVPEPATWAMFICGFGLVGGALRHSRQPRTTAVGQG